MFCPKCGRDGVEPHPTDSHLCVECVNAENTRLTYYRQHQDDWLELAKEAGVDTWTQQPGETQWEYTVWVAYRDSYPGKRPNYGDVAKQLNTTYNVVKKIAQRWSFPVRMQLWMRFVDETTLAQRKQEILDMNKSHINLAKKINMKVEAALDVMVPEAMKASEVASLMKVSAELERKARIDTEAQEELRRDIFNDAEAKKTGKQASNTDLNEIAKILLQAGAIKIKQTTEMVVDNGIEVEALDADENEG